jgi:hypothetical protein
MGSHVLQGRGAVSDALIDFAEPAQTFGAAPRDNQVRRGASECTAFLVRFDLTKLEAPAHARVAKATVSFYVWDPHAGAKTKVCAFPLKTEWDEATVTWREPAAGKAWHGGNSFAWGSDAGAPGPAAVVQPYESSDLLDPPAEYRLDVTDIVRSWLNDGAPNYGLAIAPVIDLNVDDGFMSRFQIYGSEYSEEQYTPKLTVTWLAPR